MSLNTIARKTSENAVRPSRLITRRSSVRIRPPQLYFRAALLVNVAALACSACGEPSPAGQSQLAPASPSINAVASPTGLHSPTPVAGQITVTFVSGPLTVARGHSATLQVRTAPNTSCSIEVDYKSGPATAAGLGPATSSAAGNVSWTWRVGANTTPGSWPITVTCSGASAKTNINVT